MPWWVAVQATHRQSAMEEGAEVAAQGAPADFPVSFTVVRDG
jgi:hypothetical protein